MSFDLFLEPTVPEDGGAEGMESKSRQAYFVFWLYYSPSRDMSGHMSEWSHGPLPHASSEAWFCYPRCLFPPWGGHKATCIWRIMIVSC